MRTRKRTSGAAGSGGEEEDVKKGEALTSGLSDPKSDEKPVKKQKKEVTGDEKKPLKKVASASDDEEYDPKKDEPEAEVPAVESSALDQDGMAGGSGRWTKEEDNLLRKAVRQMGPRNWKKIAMDFLKGNRTDVQCLHRWQKVLKPGLVKGPWTKEEDDTIVKCRNEGITKWSEIARHVTGRIGKQCRERWFNHLDPNIKKGDWTEEEDRKLIEGQMLLGNKWSQIAKLYLPGRPENAVKNRWNAATRKRRVGNRKKSPDGKRYGAHRIDIVTEHTKPLTKTQARFLALRPRKDLRAVGDAMEAMVSLGSDKDTSVGGEKPRPENKNRPANLSMPKGEQLESNDFMTPKSAQNVKASISPSQPLKAKANGSPEAEKKGVDIETAII